MAASPGRRPISSPGSSTPSDFGRKLYGRRKGPKLSARQEKLRRTLLPALALRLVAGLDPRAYFSTSPHGEVGFPVDDVWLEIGFGAGEHLLEQARRHPRVGLIGAEPYQAGVAKLLSKIDQELSSPVRGGGSVATAHRCEGGEAINIRVHEGDARDILEALPDASLGRVFLLFPDPWPKTRHHKRRFLQTEMLDRLSRVMRPGAELRVASDDAGYVAWTLERVRAHPDFAWAARCAGDWQRHPAGWPQTRYEAKALHGPPAYLRILRV
ncbi:MAG: tRNA (guanosine(46)-N7)-methyltransferase TrmB [Alphaproteobacteria bacterium]|nr:tRNA (guanosine(46)-N7)-methyltransferase TrmB [Alphaproteobacteria bacterium]